MLTRKRRDSTTPHVCYLVPSGTPCFARRVGSAEWLPHTTRLRRVFAEVASQDDEHFTFRLDGWEMQVGRCHVVHVGPPQTT